MAESGQIEMTMWEVVVVLASALGGAVVGAVAVSLLPVLFCALFARQAFYDGQWLLVFAVTVSTGVIFGGVAGAASALVSQGKPGAGGWTCLIGGGLLAALSILFTWGSASSRKGEVGDFLLSLIHPVNGSPFLWALGLIGWGLVPL
jgi:hypothetical protein